MSNTRSSWTNTLEESTSSFNVDIQHPEPDEKTIEKDSEFLYSVKLLQPQEMRIKTIEYLNEENRRGTAEVLKLLGFSKFLLIEERDLKIREMDPEKLSELGIPLLTDREGNITMEGRFELAGSMKVLRYELARHIGDTAKRAADFIAQESTYTPKEKAVRMIKRLLGVPPESSDIPIFLNEQEMETIDSYTDVTYPSKESAQSTFSKGVEKVLRKRPGSVGLGHTAAFCEELEHFENQLTDNTKPANAARRGTNTLHLFFDREPCFVELNINMELLKQYLESIDKSIELAKTADTQDIVER